MLNKCINKQSQGRKNPGRMIARATKFCVVTPNIFSRITEGYCSPYMPSVYQFTCINKKAPDKSKCYRIPQNGGSPLWNLHHVTLLAPGIWKSFIDIWKIGESLGSTTVDWTDSLRVGLALREKHPTLLSERELEMVLEFQLQRQIVSDT